MSASVHKISRNPKKTRQVYVTWRIVSGLSEQPNRDQDCTTTGNDSSPQTGTDSGLAEARSDNYRMHAARLQTRRRQYQTEQSQRWSSSSQVE